MRLPRFNRTRFIAVLLAAGWLISACTGSITPTGTYTPVKPAPTQTFQPTVITTPAPGQHPMTVTLPYAISATLRQSETYHFMLYIPAGYYQDISRNWPLVLALHGSGEAGADLNLLKRNGLPKKLENESDFPFIVVSPQIPAPPERQDPATAYDIEGYMNTWGWKGYINKLETLLEYLQSTLRVDDRRVYLTGLSMGGYGAWAYALKYPNRFAAVVPIAGGYHFVDDQVPSNLCDLKDLPIWVFHGMLDSSVDYRRSKILVEGLKACGAREVKFTLVPEGQHDVWSAAYDDPALWEWLLAHEIRQ